MKTVSSIIRVHLRSSAVAQFFSFFSVISVALCEIFSSPLRLRRRSRRRAFTLIEVLVALIIFSVAIFALMQGLTETLAIESSLGDRQRAMMLAENILEEIKYSGEFTEGEEEGEFEGDAAGFKWATNVVETDTLGLMEVTVTVRWPERGNEKEVIFSTLMYDNLDGNF